MTSLLALTGPAHLSLITVEAGAPTLDVPLPAEPNAALVQSFTYRRVTVVVGVHRPVEFLVPVTLEVKHPDAMTAWVFNQMCQALMGAHPLKDRVMLGLGFNVRDERFPPVRTIRANVSAYRVLTNGQVNPQPVEEFHVNHMIDGMLLAHEKDAKGLQREVARRSMMKALEPIVDRAIEQIIKHPRNV